MNNYYDDATLRDSMKLPASKVLDWLEGANKFFNAALSIPEKKLQDKLIKKGW